MNITEFLEARISEDEGRLEFTGATACPVCGASLIDEAAWWRHAYEAHERGRVLAQSKALRRIVALHEPYNTTYHGECCGECEGSAGDGQEWPCDTISALASIWDWHSDYQAWFA